jgi:hypothetical protein
MQQPELSEIAAELGLQFPAGCDVRGYSAVSGIDSAWRLKLECDTGTRQEFLSQPIFGESEFLDSERYLLGDNEEWWNPADPDTLPTAQVSLPGNRYLNVGVTEHGQARFTLYLMWHTT